MVKYQVMTNDQVHDTVKHVLQYFKKSKNKKVKKQRALSATPI